MWEGLTVSQLKRKIFLLRLSNFVIHINMAQVDLSRTIYEFLSKITKKIEETGEKIK
jgi:hypothetical protein